MDWSIARWSWRFSDNNRPLKDAPLAPLNDILPDKRLHGLWAEALRLQNRYLKERGLMRYLAALTPFSELPHPFDRPFQPDPGFKYSWLLNDAQPGEAQAVLAGPVADMEAYGVAMNSLATRIDTRLAQLEAASGNHLRGPLQAARELNRGLRVTALRARHRAQTLRALDCKAAGPGRPPRPAGGTPCPGRYDPDRGLGAGSPAGVGLSLPAGADCPPNRQPDRLSLRLPLPGKPAVLLGARGGTGPS